MTKIGKVTIWATVALIALVVIFLLINFGATNAQPPT